MADNEGIDSLLAKIQAEHQQKSLSSKPNPKTNDVLEDALAQIKQDLKDTKPKPASQKIDRDRIQANNPTNPAIDNLFDNFKADFAAKKTNTSPANLSFPKIQIPQHNNIRIDNLLSQIKEESKKQEAIEDRQINKQNITEIQQKELNIQKERRLSLQKAETWLKTLDPNSEEWLWFEQFAYSYESKVEAAIDYLKALGKM